MRKNVRNGLHEVRWTGDQIDTGSSGSTRGAPAGLGGSRVLIETNRILECRRDHGDGTAMLRTSASVRVLFRLCLEIKDVFCR